MRFEEYGKFTEAGDIRVEQEELNMYITKVFGWTFLGIAVTAAIVVYFLWGIQNSPAVASFVLNASDYFLFIGIGQIVLVAVLSWNIERLAPAAAKLLYLLYSASMGLLFTWITISYGLQAIGTAFVLTAISFGGMCIIGLTTKKDLTSFGNIMFIGLIGVLLGSIINMFLGSPMIDYLITIGGLFVFLGIALYRANSIKGLYYYGIQRRDDRLLSSLSIFAALGLYITFVNIMLSILRLMSRRR